METAEESAAQQFEKRRPLLLGLAYRLLGSMADAEDVVRAAYRRGTGEPDETRALLFTQVTRLAVERLGALGEARQAYPGPWLPDPVADSLLGPLDTAPLRDTVAYAAVHLMERLSPTERAVFVLREAYEVPYGEVARILDTTETNCRRMHLRSRRRLAVGRDRFGLTWGEHADLLTRLVGAARDADRAALADLLTEDAVAWYDAGGTAQAPSAPVEGAADVSAFLVGRHPYGAPRTLDVNGRPALALIVEGVEQVIVIDVWAGLVDGVYCVLNPDKLGHART
ncbi:sigma factor-like helix-turn-helix DNA-binding protein [Streptomyces sp. NPDC090106]|uniref:sigma factor-like helix-turn-helix DNA-binding protein n=1 Tax=Streptomyces sp. NPDC090106 TaxID=3365946 RepID=UPI003830EAB2